MSDSWKSYEKAAETGPLTIFFKVLGPLVLIGAVLGGVGYAFSVCGETANVAQKELGPNAAVQKYMWLKDAHAQLEKKQADIKVYQSRIDTMDATYKGVPRNQWARDDREDYNLWINEVAGAKASYNDLAAQYNAKMSEVNWSFASVGGLPQGATEPLPKEYVPYTDK